MLITILTAETISSPSYSLGHNHQGATLTNWIENLKDS